MSSPYHRGEHVFCQVLFPQHAAKTVCMRDQGHLKSPRLAPDQVGMVRKVLPWIGILYGAYIVVYRFAGSSVPAFADPPEDPNPSYEFGQDLSVVLGVLIILWSIWTLLLRD